VTAGWQRRRILVWGKTRPEVSRNYRETVCTGGIFEDTGRLVRLYPIPLRYLDDAKYFKKYQWITADVARASDRDNRPESYRIRPDGITLEETIPTTGDWSERAKWVLRSENVVRSVEELQARQATDHTSLGVLKPKKIVQITAEKYPKADQDMFWRRYKDTVAQMQLELDDDRREPKPLTPPDFHFRVRFTCDDPACQLVHKFGILDWEIDALYFRMKQKYGPHRATQEVVKTLEKFCGPEYDIRFFLGNISNHPTNFTIVGLWYPKKLAARGPSLFDEVSA
jgi:hypothetical protein